MIFRWRSRSGAGPCSWIRERREGPVWAMRAACLLDAGVLVVRDVVQSPGEAFRVAWRFATGPLALEPSGAARGLRFRLLPLPDISPLRIEERPGFVSLSGRDAPAPGLDYVFEAGPPHPSRIWAGAFASLEPRMGYEGHSPGLAQRRNSRRMASHSSARTWKFSRPGANTGRPRAGAWSMAIS